MEPKKVAIILTTIERPQLLEKCLQSIVDNWPQGVYVGLFVGNQDGFISLTSRVIEKIIAENPDKVINHYIQEYDCGISKARNQLITYANILKYDYILLTADSIMFENMDDLNFLIQQMEKSGYSRCGLQLHNRIGWEAKLNLIPNEHFELDFIDPKEKEKQLLVSCDIVRNFNLSTTESMVKVGYDNNLIMSEHEDEAYRYKQAGYKTCCTNLCNGLYVKEQNNEEYDRIRRTNFAIGMARLKNKYSLKSWINYKNLENTRQ